MRLHYLSDLHLERATNMFNIDKLNKNSKNTFLCVAGDIGNPFKPKYSDFLRDVSLCYESVFFISGNHEYSNRTNNRKNIVDEHIRSIAYKICNLTYLEAGKVHSIDKYAITGTTLWSYYSNPKTVLQDHINERHLNEKRILHHTIKISSKPLIVMTHHLPSFDLISPKFKTGRYNLEGWASDSNELICDPIVHWICGHSHIQTTCVINNIPVSINATTSYEPMEINFVEN